MVEQTNTIRFRNLSIDLKIIVILGWIMAGFYALFFLIGFIAGVTGGTA